MQFVTFITASALSSLSMASLSIAAAPPSEPPQSVRSSSQLQAYQAQDFSHLLGMPGFSDNALNNHFKLYQGYVTNTNLLITTLNQLTQDGKQRTPQFQELKRRFGWEFDGMRLHELYFQNLGGKDTQLDPQTPLAQQIVRDFGSFEAWKKDFVETGMLRGIGWSVLYVDPIEGRLINTWIGEHDMGHLAGGKPILIMDVWEHAFMPDYGLDRAAYINAFFNNIKWDVVSKRYQ